MESFLFIPHTQEQLPKFFTHQIFLGMNLPKFSPANVLCYIVYLSFNFLFAQLYSFSSSLIITYSMINLCLYVGRDGNLVL